MATNELIETQPHPTASHHLVSMLIYYKETGADLVENSLKECIGELFLKNPDKDGVTVYRSREGQTSLSISSSFVQIKSSGENLAKIKDVITRVVDLISHPLEQFRVTGTSLRYMLLLDFPPEINAVERIKQSTLHASSIDEKLQGFNVPAVGLTLFIRGNLGTCQVEIGPYPKLELNNQLLLRLNTQHPYLNIVDSNEVQATMESEIGFLEHEVMENLVPSIIR